jgi:putative mRNA 3-end processing factor
MGQKLLKLTSCGIYCEQGDFYIDPWRPVSKAIITHAHSDHARSGNQYYLTSKPGELLLKARLGPEINLQTLSYGEKITINGVEISLHPAGHILGSSQVRVSYKGQIWVASGDYKLEADNTCHTFEPVKCHVFISEATFALPIYVWQPQNKIFDDINAWWQRNQATGKTSILLGYALGKAQRLLSGLDPNIGLIYTHGAVENLTQIYRQSNISMPITHLINEQEKNIEWSKGIIIAPPSALIPGWLKRFGAFSTAFASGWMKVRGARRLKNMDQGFVLSDHADWPSLLQAIAQTEAEEILITHGQSESIVKYLIEKGVNAKPLKTQFNNDGEA